MSVRKSTGMKTESVMLIPIHGIPLIQPGDDLVEVILQCLDVAGDPLKSGDILVLTQKIVSKAEGAMVDIASGHPSRKVRRLAHACDKDARLMALILSESKKVLRQSQHLIVTEHKKGWICANAGVDYSNVPGEYVTLLPKDPDRTAKKIRARIRKLKRIETAVLIIDSHGRPFRKGAIGVALGCSGLSALVNQRGKRDLFNYRLTSTEVALADELASAASLLMGQANEGIPAVIIRGLKYPKGHGSAMDLIRPEEIDLFR
jgi:coenzyme F420-0:L-glutamate ligase / coenzyme F420-1:gamma-L-glutamate ligase